MKIFLVSKPEKNDFYKLFDCFNKLFILLNDLY